MSEFTLCKNGHYYQSSLAECPYCPKTTAHRPEPAALDKTRVVNPVVEEGLDKTKIMQTPNEELGNTQPGNTSNLAKTQIFTGNSPVSSPTPQHKPAPPQTGRKLVGWLVSFTIDSNGADFRVYEGRNTIGSDLGCDIVVTNDGAVSSKHLTILNRMGAFKFKDELSTNGTFINDTFEEEGNLKDGDTIKIGSTVFKFRTVG
ncbi:FHA domain-containing protein [Rhodocytophaga aerolata]|uniref:FHA domain-containing protein n=1 Tax=Rhodocytophaga aerolata TaxID=455078 RepID=A0ABT8R4E3_9BACT|nr:FHA domain-containing protein [Rhodocytophaga aerolata]MDO1446955.1 FHA domain-containing protein [Rhodocytophaga aerolata]